MKTFSYYAARASIRTARHNNTAHVRYLGPLCGRGFAALAPQVMQETATAAAMLIRMDGCLWLAGEMPAIQRRPGPMPPACVVVREDQYDCWSAYALAAAEAGFRRVVFLDSQLALAQEWLLRQSMRPGAPLLS